MGLLSELRRRIDEPWAYQMGRVIQAPPFTSNLRVARSGYYTVQEVLLLSSGAV